MLQRRLDLHATRLRPYRDALRAAADVTQLVVALRAAAFTVKVVKAAESRIEVAWTFPSARGTGLRTTGGVAREIIDVSSENLLIVGYAVTVDPELTGLAAQTVASVARAAERGVTVTVVLHREANRQALIGSWRQGVPLPSIFTWPAASSEKASVHAKLLIADRQDGLITSANLTYHGFERNLEMGLRVTGEAAAQIHDRILELIVARELVPWND